MAELLDRARSCYHRFLLLPIPAGISCRSMICIFRYGRKRRFPLREWTGWSRRTSSSPSPPFIRNDVVQVGRFYSCCRYKGLFFLCSAICTFWWTATARYQLNEKLHTYQVYVYKLRKVFDKMSMLDFTRKMFDKMCVMDWANAVCLVKCMIDCRKTVRFNKYDRSPEKAFDKILW